MDPRALFDIVKGLGQLLLGGMLASGGFLLSIFAPVLVHVVPSFADAPTPRKLSYKERSALAARRPNLKADNLSEKSHTSHTSRSSRKISPSPERHVTFPTDLQAPLRISIPKIAKVPNKSPHPTGRRAPRPPALSLPSPTFQLQVTVSPDEIPEAEISAALPSTSPTPKVVEGSMGTPKSPNKHLCPLSARRAVVRSVSSPIPKLKKRPSSPSLRPSDEQAASGSFQADPSTADTDTPTEKSKLPCRNRRSPRPILPVARTQPYAAPYFFPPPGSAEAKDYVQLLREERRGPRRATSMDMPISALIPSDNRLLLDTVSRPTDTPPPESRFSWGAASDGEGDQTPLSPNSGKTRSPSRPFLKRLGKS